MHSLESKQICETVVVDDDANFRSYIKTNPTGFVVVTEPYGELDGLTLPSDAGDFSKWVRQNTPSVNVETHKADRYIVRRSGDYWLPLVFLASDIALPIYLNLVANYIYDKMKGALKGEAARVHLSAVYEDRNAGVVKRFNFEGDLDSLQKVIKRFDLNQFLDE